MGLAVTSRGDWPITETGEAVFADEAETEAVTTSGADGGFVSLLLDTDCDLRPSTLCLGDCEAVLEGIIGGVPIRSAMEGGLMGDGSIGESCTREALTSGMLGRLLVEPSRRFQKEENRPDLFLVSTRVGGPSFFSTIRHPTGISSGTTSDRFLTAVSQSDDDPLLRMKCAIGLSRVMAECLVRRSDFVISFATADLANGTLGSKVCSGKNVSMRSLLKYDGCEPEHNRENTSRTALPHHRNHVSNSEAIPLEAVNHSMNPLSTSFPRTVRRFQ